ncbi:BnaC05g32960D [Brassica napus]|uniref:BnaC05g32960D protein n=1 Tax=Brassica napus TaxID=3708 RepID=A0A078GHH8_BRANA|nr:BnaC05g32960D [Brassica napus]
MKTMISNLPVDLLEEILSRVLLKSIGAVRSTCKNWNVLSKDERFANKHIEKTAASQRDKEVLVITVNTKDHLISVKFYDFHKKNFDPSMNRNVVIHGRLLMKLFTAIGDFREVESIEAPYSRLDNLVDCYVPSSVQI